MPLRERQEIQEMLRRVSAPCQSSQIDAHQPRA